MKTAIVSGMECAGSTAIWQMIQQLGVDVSKEHGYTASNENRIVFATLRDIRDVVTSLWRRECLGTKNDPDNYALGCMKYVEARFHQMRYYEMDANAEIIRYESFMSNPEGTFDRICQRLEIEVSPTRRRRIIAYCSLEKNKERADSMKEFSEWNRDNLIHGNHISTGGKIGSWNDLAATLNPETVETIEEKSREFLLHFGYETN